MKPDEAFGLIFSWDNVVVNADELLCFVTFVAFLRKLLVVGINR